MIQNERQYRITKAQADKFRATLEEHTKTPPAAGAHPKLKKLQSDALRAKLEDLDRELQAYDRLQRSGRKHLEARVEDLGQLLIQARIARGWTQAQLGERCGLHMQKIQQYEATAYEAASVTRIRSIFMALGAEVNVSVRLAELPNLDEIKAAVSKRLAPARQR